ncbi:MAG: T9SS type A sorting domain-containing protein [Flavobacteriia bacterium]|nr:T9SS type A sorting domain-containing protein [Flavobacteriia bacterium]
MKKLYALALLMGGSMWAGAQTYAVDFAVDIKATNPNQDTVIIAGDFAAADASGLYTNWNDGVGNPDSAVYAMDPDMDGIWTFTANLPDGSYQYKFLNGAGGWEGVANRTFTVSGGAVQLDTFCYNVVTPGICPTTRADTFDVTIQIDMSTVCGFDPATDIVDFAGEPNAWAGDTMTDANNDLIYEISYTDVPVQVDLTTGTATFEGKCRINSNWGTSEGGANRIFEMGSDTVLPVRCYGAFAYGACTPIPAPANVTFQVDMNAEVPAGDGKVFVMGDFTNWQDNALEMTDPDGDGVYEVQVANFCPPELYFKFINGTPDQQGGTGAVEESADFSDIGGCGVDNGSFSDNRYLMRPTDANDVIITFAFNTCNGIQGGVSVEEFSNETIFLNPNPMSDRATVALPEGEFNGQIVDLTGRVIRTFNNASTEITIEREGMNSGIYMLVLTNENGETNTTKFVVE